ncbi:MAG: hypothetical protein JO023_17365, partial [Chloroflexi bacterium]|nr:hypothetical protein [Chloroflexota bacterium]
MDGWYDLLHVVDSSFPTGAYAHSAGLESLGVRDADGLSGLLETRIEQPLGRLDLVFLLHAGTGDLVELDARLHTMLIARETRAASAQIGTALLRATCELRAEPRLVEFLQAQTPHHQPVAFGAVMRAFAIPSRLAAASYAFHSVRSVVSAAQRLGILGQRDAQRLLHALKPAVAAAVSLAAGLGLDDAGAFSPL